MNCTAASYQTEKEARDVTRKLRRWHLAVMVSYCEECDRYHLKGEAKRLKIPKKSLAIMRQIAMGFTQQETAEIVSMGLAGVRWHVRELKFAFNALSDTHLVAIMIALGLLSPNEFVPAVAERTHENVRTENDRRSIVQRDRAPRFSQSA